MAPRFSTPRLSGPRDRLSVRSSLLLHSCAFYTLLLLSFIGLGTLFLHSLKEMKRAMEQHELGNLTLATMVMVVLLLVSCGALDNTSNGSSPPANNSTDFAGQRVHIVGSTALLPLATKAADLFHQQYPQVT